jgi:hypothetical protein
MPIIVYVVARIFWDYYKYGIIIGSVGKIFIVIMVVQIVLLTYLGYWLLKVAKKK